MTRHHRGFTILLALAAVAFVGAALFIFSGIAATMLHQARADHVQAEARNLTLSALEWARLHRDRPGRTSLDAEQLGAIDGSLDVTIEQDDSAATARITVGCSRGRMTISRTASYELD
jgi:hypothetical protein